MRENTKVKVVLFSGGRGSRVLSTQLINNPQVMLTLAINGYDDGASTGEVRRFLGDSLGPSDYRKNASWLAGELHSCGPALLELLDLRFPVDCSYEEAIESLNIISSHRVYTRDDFQKRLRHILNHTDAEARRNIAHKLRHFHHALTHSGHPFAFADCSLGNLVFAGCFLKMGRDFNAAIADYCRLLYLPPGLIENVTNGANAFLIALDGNNRILSSEAEIVNTNRRHHIKDIYLIDRPLTEADLQWLLSAPLGDLTGFLEKRSTALTPNLRLLDRIAEADVIIYAPGTQHSSLLPSYLTPGLGPAIAQNLTARKLLITNLQEDVEIPDSSAVDLINKAVYYFKEKDRLSISTPCLITHYLINDPGSTDHAMPYVQPGRLESLEDPRLVRIENYEEGVTGRHDAAKLLTPFVDASLKNSRTTTVAVLLLDTVSLNKITQTILEMLRGGIHSLPISTTVFYNSTEGVNTHLFTSLPFDIYNIHSTFGDAKSSFLRLIDRWSFDYIILFESSGMYQGEEIANLASLLNHRRFDAVWGSRRLTVKDRYQSSPIRYRHNMILGELSYLGSHMLSLTYLLLYGRYIADTLSGVRAIKTSYLKSDGIDLKSKYVNQYILALLLRDKADIVEIPVQFFPLPPAKVRRTTVCDGIQSLLTIIGWRFKARKHHTGNPLV